MNSCWRVLPEDLINEIILFVPGYKNMYNLSLCCKNFSQTFELTLYQSFLNLFAEKFGHYSTLKVFDKDNVFNTHFIIDVKLSDTLTFKLLLCGIRQMKYLKSLDIHTYTSFEQQGILKKLWFERGLDLKKLYLNTTTLKNILYIVNKKEKEKAEKEKTDKENKIQILIEYIIMCGLLPYSSQLIEKHFNINDEHIFFGGVFIYILVYITKIYNFHF